MTVSDSATQCQGNRHAIAKLSEQSSHRCFAHRSHVDGHKSQPIITTACLNQDRLSHRFACAGGPRIRRKWSTAGLCFHRTALQRYCSCGVAGVFFRNFGCFPCKKTLAHMAGQLFQRNEGGYTWDLVQWRRLHSRHGPCSCCRSEPSSACQPQVAVSVRLRKNSQVRQFRDHLGRRGTCYPDVHALPEDIPSTDILVFGSSCTSLSQLCNRKRDLTHTDPQDPLASSGATMKSCLQYVTNKLPQVVLFENVPGILGRIAGEDGRNIDKVYNQLYAAGYSCQHAVFDSQSFMLPQRRRRVYAMATRGDIDPECCAAWPRLVRACSPLERIPLSACLL
jgi:hypothetical protein